MRVCEFLEWTDLEAVRLAAKATPFVPALHAAIISICRNTWSRLAAPSAVFDFRVRSSMLSSVDRLKRGELSTRVHQADMRILAARNSTMEPATKMARTDNASQEAALAKLIAVMFQTVSAAVERAAALVRTLEASLTRDASTMDAGATRALEELRGLFESVFWALRKYRKKVVIPAAHLLELRRLQQRLELLQTQTDLLAKGWSNDAQGRAEAAVAWTREPFAGALRPGQVQLDMRLQVLTLPGVTGEAVSSCELVCDEFGQEGDRLTGVLSNHKTKPTPAGEVHFAGLKFTKPSRQRLVQLTCQVTLSGPNKAKRVLSSRPSLPLLVFSHQKQLLATFQTLLKQYIFNPSGLGEKSHVSWPHFVNTLQEFFCAQLPVVGAELVAGLTSSDLQYVRNKFLGRGLVPIDRYGDIFGFFGPMLFSLYLHRDYVTLWREGYIMGFAPRDTVDLRPYGPGAFLLRYSTGVPGELVISFCSNRGDTTKHYLIREGDVSPKSRQMLASFLWKTPNLKFILRLPLVNGEYSMGSKLIKEPKEKVLQPWLPADGIPTTFAGYEYAGGGGV